MGLEEVFEMDMAFSSPSPTRYSTLSQGSEDYLCIAFPQSEGTKFHLSSSEEVDVAGHDQDETGDSSPQSIQYMLLLEVVTRVVANLK